jgi:hypothetical protein
VCENFVHTQSIFLKYRQFSRVFMCQNNGQHMFMLPYRIKYIKLFVLIRDIFYTIIHVADIFYHEYFELVFTIQLRPLLSCKLFCLIYHNKLEEDLQFKYLRNCYLWALKVKHYPQCWRAKFYKKSGLNRNEENIVFR